MPLNSNLIPILTLDLIVIPDVEDDSRPKNEASSTPLQALTKVQDLAELNKIAKQYTLPAPVN